MAKPDYINPVSGVEMTPPLFKNGRYANPKGAKRLSGLKLSKLMHRFFVEGKPNATPKQLIPVHQITSVQLAQLPDDGSFLFRLGHSSILLKLNGDYWLFDPVFSKRVSPSQVIGPKRFHAVPIDINELPPLKGVVLSHNHYDHLDKTAIGRLAAKAEQLYMPLGMAELLTRWGVCENKLTEFDWWQSLPVGPLTLACTPSQHFSGRGIQDSNRSLWCSWVLQSPTMKLFFSGDSGYFDGFARIQKVFGGFDWVCMEAGAYDRFWPSVHMHPDESFQAFIDLRGVHLLPIHNGTFDLSFHPWYEPFERIYHLARQKNVSLSTPEMGQCVNLDAPEPTLAWWKHLMPREAKGDFRSQVHGSG